MFGCCLVDSLKGVVHAWVIHRVLECNEFKTIFAIRPLSPMRDAALAAEATPWHQPLSYNTAAASGRVITLRFKAGRALDAQEAVPDLFGDGRPSNAD